MTLKFYDDFKEALESEGDASATDPRLLRRDDLADLGQTFLLAEKLQETKVEPEYTDETTTTLVKCVTPELPAAPEKPKNTGGDSPEEIAYDKYMHILLYNAFESPTGQSLHSACKEIQCKEKLKTVARGVVSLLAILYKPDISLPFSNIHQENIFYDGSTHRLVLVNMFNTELDKEIRKLKGEDVSIEKTEESKADDLKDLGMLLIWMMVKDQLKDTAFMKDTKNSLELFRHINKQKNLEHYLDFNLGVARPFTEAKEHENMLNLEESFYDFAMKLVGPKLCKQNTHEPFDSLEAVLEHPFLAKQLPLEERPSDI